jgi:lysophospholipase L1-like esterase
MVLENIAENIFSMSELAKANGIDVFICSVLPAKDFPWSPGLNPAEKVVRLNAILKDYCSENNINYVDYYTIMNDGDGGLKVPEHTSADDLVHPNSEGYKVMEDVILKSLYPSN